MRAIKASANSESKRMFESDFFEFFSRIPWWQPLVIYAPLIVIMIGQAFVAGASFFAVVGGWFVGLTIWTLLEYWAHRVLFHWDAQSKLGKRFVWILHGVHHDWPNDKLRLVFPPGLSIPLALGFFFLFSAIFGDVHRFATFAGLVSGYLAYDMIHYATHHYTSDNAVFKYLRKYHMAHHFKHEPLRYGVSNPLWDYVFGTAPKKA